MATNRWVGTDDSNAKKVYEKGNKAINSVIVMMSQLNSVKYSTMIFLLK